MSTKTASLAPPATLAEVLQRIAAMDALPRQKRHDLSSAVRRVARSLDCVPADIPADPEALRQRLSVISPAAAGMTKNRWRNVRALLVSALALAGTKVTRGHRLAGLVPCWRSLLEQVGNRYERARLSRFFSYASVNGIDPDDVDNDTVAGFAENLKRNSLVERQTQIVRDLCLAWNRCAASVKGWSLARLTAPDRRRAYALPVDAYPASFGADLEAYLGYLASEDLFARTGRGAASPATLRDVRLRLLQMAAALVHSGRPPDTICRLADLVAPETLSRF